MKLDSSTKTVLAKGATHGRALTDILADRFNLKSYCDSGVDMSRPGAGHEPMRRALAAIKANGGGTLYLPNSVVNVNPVVTADQALVIPGNTTIQGDGQKSVIQSNSGLLSSNGHWSVFQITGSNVRFSGFDMDGASGAVTTTAPSFVQFMFFYKGIWGAMDNITIEDLWCHDIYSFGGQESFGFTFNNIQDINHDTLVTGALTRLTISRCRGWNVGGTPFHANGYILTTTPSLWNTGYLTDGVYVSDLVCWNNTIQGFSAYGAKNVRIHNSEFYGNSYRGINVEWCDSVDVWACKCYSNVKAGIGGSGKWNGRIRNCRVYSNNTGNNAADGEISSFAGAWYLGSPAPYGNWGNVEIRNCEVIPSGSNKHVFYAPDFSASLNVGTPMPDSILIQADDIQNWLIGDNSSPSQQQFCVQHQGGPASLGGANLGRQIDWFGSGATVAAYGGAGNDNPGAIAVTGTNANDNAFSKGGLLPGRTYRLRCRIKAEDANATWKLMVHETNSGVSQTVLAYYTPTAAQVGTWQTLDIITTISSSWQPARVQILRALTGTASVLDVDYINAEELESAFGNSEQRISTRNYNGTALAWAATIGAADLMKADSFYVNMTSNIANNFPAPLHPIVGARLAVFFKNGSGGTITNTTTFDAVFKMAAWSMPASLNGIRIEWEYDGSHWNECWRSSAYAY